MADDVGEPTDAPGVGPHDTNAVDAPARGIVGILLAIWLAVTLARLMQAQPLQSANDRSRWATVRALVDEGTYRIDNIRRLRGWDTIDLVRHEGHFYSTKPPVFPTLVAGLYWLEKQTLGWTLHEDPAGTSRILLLFVNVLPMLTALLLLGRLLRRFTTSTFAYAFVMASAGFGTLLSPFLIVLNNHTPGAVSVVFTLCAAVPILAERRRSGWLFAMAGFWAAATCCFELPAAAFGLAMFVLLFLADRQRTLIWFVPAALIPLAAFFYTNDLATGSWKPFYLDYGTEKYEFIDNGVPSYWMHPRGIDRAKDSPLIYFLHCTVGHHGLVSLSPVFLLTLAAWLRLRLWIRSPLRQIHWLGLALSVVVFAFFLSKTENYNYGGVSVALRWMLWLVPFWLLATVPLLNHWQPGRWGRGICLLLLCTSAFSAWYPFSSPWNQPWLFNVLTKAGWIDYSDPPRPQQEPFYSWIRQLPETSSETPLTDYWIEFSGLDKEGRLRRLRLSDAGGLDVAGRRARKIEFTETMEDGTTSRQQWVLDLNAFRANARPAELLLWPEGTPTAAEQHKAVTFLEGLPVVWPYAAGKLVFLGSPLRAEAFQTRHAASRVLGTPRKHPRPTIHRRDLWLTDDVPFGVLEFRLSIQDVRTGEVVHQSTMRAVAAGRVAAFDPQKLVFE